MIAGLGDTATKTLGYHSWRINSVLCNCARRKGHNGQQFRSFLMI